MKSIQNLSGKEIKNVNVVKGGEKGLGEKNDIVRINTWDPTVKK